jgi:hypothetical protein
MAKRNLFGKGSWPADDKTKRTYWSIFERYLSTRVSRNVRQLTKFALEIDVDSLAAFIGIDPEMCLAAFAWDQAAEAEFDDLADQLEDADESSGNELTKRYLRGAYIRYCAAHEISPFLPTN